MLGQFAGWPRLLADCARVLFPGTARYAWKQQFRVILILFAISNFVIVYSFGLKPVKLVQFSAILDGTLLIPLEALAVGVALYVIMPRFFSEQLRAAVRPGPIIGIGLVLAAIVYGYCWFHVPALLAK